MDVFCDSRKFTIFSHINSWFTIQLNQEFPKNGHQVPGQTLIFLGWSEVLPGFDNFMPSGKRNQRGPNFPKCYEEPQEEGPYLRGSEPLLSLKESRN